MDDSWAFLVLSGKVDANLDMAALDFVGQGFADVVNQTGAFGSSNICAQLGSHYACQMSHLDGVLQYVLTVAGTVSHAPQQLDHIRVHTVNVGLQNRTLTVLLDFVFDFTLCFFYRFLDACRMDSSVLNQALQSGAGNLTFNGIVAGQGDCFRCVVDNQVNAGQRFQCADVSPFTTDDASLHLIVWQRNDRYGHFTHIIGRTFLDSSCDDFSCFLVGFILELLFIEVDFNRLFVYQLVLQIGKQVFLCLLCGVAGDFFQRFKLAGFDFVGFLQATLCLFDFILQGFLFFLQIVHLAVDGFFLLLDAAL